MTDKFKTSMDRIVESLEGDTPSTDIYADSIQRIADALENGSGGGGSGGGFAFIDLDTTTMTLGASYTDIKAILDGGSMPCIVIIESDMYTVLFLASVYGQSNYYQADFFNALKNAGGDSAYVMSFSAQSADADMTIKV